MNQHAEGHKAEYLIAQYMEDVFRREARNIGVFVRKHGVCSALFFGESAPGVIDGRRLKSLAAPEVYRQWIQYWRRTLETSPDPFTELTKYPNANYPVLSGGEIWDTGEDSTGDIAQFLYSALVAEEGFAVAFNGETETSLATEGAMPRLSRDVETSFRNLNILSANGDQLPLVQYPVRQRFEVQGKTEEPHRPQFSQLNGKLFVIETVDFTQRTKERARDHAGFTAFMFDDILDAKISDVRPIAVYQVEPGDESLPEVRYGLSMLHKSPIELVNWGEATQRAAFIESRRRVAMGLA